MTDQPPPSIQKAIAALSDRQDEDMQQAITNGDTADMIEEMKRYHAHERMLSHLDWQCKVMVERGQDQYGPWHTICGKWAVAPHAGYCDAHLDEAIAKRRSELDALLAMRKDNPIGTSNYVK